MGIRFYFVRCLITGSFGFGNERSMKMNINPDFGARGIERSSNLFFLHNFLSCHSIILLIFLLHIKIYSRKNAVNVFYITKRKSWRLLQRGKIDTSLHLPTAITKLQI